MADDILDVVTRLTFDVEDAELKQVTSEVQKTISKISQLTQQQTAYENRLRQTSRLEIAERKQVQAQIDRTKKAIELQTSALENQIISNKKLQTAISQEIGLIGRLNAQMTTLKQKRDIANDPAKIRDYNRQIAVSQAQLNNLTGSGKGVLSGFGGAILQGLGVGTGIGLVTQAIGEIQRFVSESSRLAAETEGVKVAFDRLNDPDLLSNLRTATRGTVSDLELMKNAVQFNNFGLPVEKLATALEFARIRAKETGQSVEFLVQSITTGIGRQSPLILDNLGINARRVREEFQKTGDFAEAAFKIISEESAKAGNDLVTFAEKQAQINAQIENAQAGFGSFFNRVQGGVFEFLKGTFSTDLETGGIDKLIEYINALNSLNDEPVNPKGVLAFTPSLFTFSLLPKFAPPSEILTAQNATVENIRGKSNEELEALKEDIDRKRNLLTANDAKEIDRLNKLSEAIKKQQDIISGAAAKKAAEQKKKEQDDEIKRLEKLKELNEDITRQAIRINSAPITERDVDELGFPRVPQAQRISDNVPSFIRGVSGTASQAEREGLLQATDSLGNAIETAEQIAARKQKQKEREEKERESIRKIIGFYEDAATSIINTFQTIYDAKLQFLDAEIQITSARITAATELAKRGNTEVLDAELENLNKLQEEREKIARRQLAINTLMQASSLALATVQSFQAVANAAATGDPYTGALRIAAIVAALAAGFSVVAGLSQSFKEGFAEGGYTGEGGKHEPAGIVHKDEFVFNKEKTKQFRPLFDAIHTGKIKDMPFMMGSTSTANNTGIEKKLDSLIDVVASQEVKVNQVMDAYGLSQTVQKLAMRDKLRNARR